MSKRTPTIRATGTYKLKAPWSTKSGVKYTCMAIKSFPEMEERGVNVFTTIYQANGLSTSLYNSDKRINANIVTLMADGQPTIYVPDTFILEFPNMGLVPYSHIVMSVSLGALPDDITLEFLQQQIRDKVREVAGVTSDVLIHRAPTTDAVNTNEHTSLEMARNAAITLTDTDGAKIDKLSGQLNDANEKIKTLEGILTGTFV